MYLVPADHYRDKRRRRPPALRLASGKVVAAANRKEKLNTILCQTGEDASQDSRGIYQT